MTFDLPRATPPAPPRPPRPRAAYAPPLFVLGAMVGLMAVLGRVAQELEASAIASFSSPGLPGVFGSRRSPLPPILNGLSTPEQRIIVVGFAASAALIAAAAYAWFSGGQPKTEAAHLLTSLAAWISGMLALSLIAALLLHDPTLRLGVLIGAGTLAMLLYTRLVLFLAAFTLPRS